MHASNLPARFELPQVRGVHMGGHTAASRQSSTLQACLQMFLMLTIRISPP